MKTNLLLLDSYKNMEDLVQIALPISNHYNRKLKIIYVFDFNWMRQAAFAGGAGTSGISIVNAEREIFADYETAEKKVKKVVDECLKKQSAKYPVEISVSKNNRIDLIKRELQNDPDLIVLISNRQSYSEITGGAISYPKFIEHVNCPVLILPDKLKHTTFHNAVYASDYNPEDVRSLKHLSNFLEQSGNTHLTILHNEENFDFDAKLKWIGFKDVVQSEISDGNLDFLIKKKKDFIKGMEEYNLESDPDLLVMLNEKKGFFEDIFSSGTTKNMLTHFDKPLLVYHEK